MMGVGCWRACVACCMPIIPRSCMDVMSHVPWLMLHGHNVARCMHADPCDAPCRTSQWRAAAVAVRWRVTMRVAHRSGGNHDVACCMLHVACYVLHGFCNAHGLCCMSHAVRRSAARRRRRRTGGPETSYSFSSPTSRPTQVSLSAREYPGVPVH